MRRNLKIVLIIISACLVTGATAFGVLIFATWGEIDYENTYFYNPSSPSAIERININSDIGSVLISYNKTPTDYFAQIDLDIHIVGIFVKDSTLSDFFYPIIWENDTSPVTTFTLDAKATTWFIFGVNQQIQINLTLRTDVIYDLNVLTSTGAISMNIPDNIVLNNTILGASTGAIFLNSSKNTTFQGNVGLSTSTGAVNLYAKLTNFTQDVTIFASTGDIGLNFSRCIIGGHLTGTVSTGYIGFRSYNMKYMGAYNWKLQSSTGAIGVTIYQYNEMDANITGSILTSTGSVNIYYKDYLTTVGAKFTCFTSTGSNSYIPLGSGGFSESGVNPKTIESNDYDDAINRYTFSVAASTGSITVQAESL